MSDRGTSGDGEEEEEEQEDKEDKGKGEDGVNKRGGLEGEDKQDDKIEELQKNVENQVG